MIKHFKVIKPGGEALTLELKRPEKSGFFVRKIDGLGPSKSIINMGESLFQDGALFNSSRISNRNIVLDLGFLDYLGQTIEQIRYQSYRFFPMKTLLTFEVETDGRIGLASGYVETNEPNIFSKEEGSIISILCPDSFFYGKDIITTTFSGIVDGFEFPFENPSLTESLIEFGDVFVETEANVFYTGDIPTGVIIYITFTGSVNDLTIHNVSNSSNFAINSEKVIDLTGSDFIVGDLLVISTIKGNKFISLIRAGLEYNILNAVDFLADWFQISKGDNVFTYTADSGLNNMQFSIDHLVVYEGL